MGMKQVFGLSLALAKAGFKVKNEGSYLGILWYLLNPLITFLLLLVIFSDRLGKNIPAYPAYLLLGIIMFNLFQQITQESTKTIRNNRWLIKSIYFPREALVGANIFKMLFSHIFEIILLVLFLLFSGIPLAGMLFYPLILFFYCLFLVGCSLLLSSLAVYFTDLENIWGFLSRLIWLATPIFYSIEGQAKLGLVNLFNPVYYYISLTRGLIIYSQVPELWMVAVAFAYAVFFFFAGLFVFNRLKRNFAELI